MVNKKVVLTTLMVALIVIALVVPGAFPVLLIALAVAIFIRRLKKNQDQ